MLRVNPKLCEIVGYGEEELFKPRFRDITYADDLAADLARAVSLLRSGALKAVRRPSDALVTRNSNAVRAVCAACVNCSWFSLLL